MTHGIFSPLLLHNWAFRSPVHLSREMKSPFQSKGGRIPNDSGFAKLGGSKILCWNYSKVREELLLSFA